MGSFGALTFGATVRAQWNNVVRKYQHRDVVTAPSGRITATISEAQGELASAQRQLSLLGGVFAQESLRFLGDRVTLDVGARLDANRFRIAENELAKYDYAQGRCGAGAGESKTDRTDWLPAPKVGLSLAVLPEVSSIRDPISNLTPFDTPPTALHHPGHESGRERGGRRPGGEA